MQEVAFYISGNITGTQDGNRSKFERAEASLRFQYGTGVMIFNPHNLIHQHDKSWEAYMRNDLRAMFKCNAVIALDDWKSSRGAIMEVLLANLFAIPVYPFREHSFISTNEAIRLSAMQMFSLFAKVLLNRF